MECPVDDHWQERIRKQKITIKCLEKQLAVYLLSSNGSVSFPASVGKNEHTKRCYTNGKNSLLQLLYSIYCKELMCSEELGHSVRHRARHN